MEFTGSPPEVGVPTATRITFLFQVENFILHVFGLDLQDMARPEGFEPPTLCLEGRRSIRLSYGRFDSILHRLALDQPLFWAACSGPVIRLPGCRAWMIMTQLFWIRMSTVGAGNAEQCRVRSHDERFERAK